MSLLSIGQGVTIYVGWFLFLTGVIGNSINVLVFSTVRTYRTTPCTFYFLIHSIDSIVFLTMNLISRIYIVGYGIDLTRNSLIWCKIRQYLINVISLFAFTCSCLAAIDQYLSTSRSVYLRSLSNIKLSHRITLISFLICCLHGIPVALYFNISSISSTCVITNNIFSIYAPIYVLSLTCIIPILIMVSFGYLTYRNIHLTRILAQQQADRQLTKMTLIQIIVVLIAIGPYGLINAYSLITNGINKDTNRLIIESFVSTIVTLIVYIYYVGSFYMFLISSSRFRRTVRDRIFFWRRPNLINPTQQLTFNRQTRDRRTAI